METVKLPRHDWFMGSIEIGGNTNCFKGSLRVEQYQAALTSGSLHYQVSVENRDDEEKTMYLKVVSWMIGRHPDYKKTFEEINEFIFTPEGILEAQEFLDTKYKEICRRDILGIDIE